MRRFIATLLVAVTLLANLAWATDRHVESWTGHQPTVTETGSGSDHAPDSACAHHCCHGAAHLLALAELPSLPTLWGHQPITRFEPRRWRNHDELPPLPPPNA